jgi:hypothetical protein
MASAALHTRPAQPHARPALWLRPKAAPADKSDRSGPIHRRFYGLGVHAWAKAIACGDSVPDRAAWRHRARLVGIMVRSTAVNVVDYIVEQPKEWQPTLTKLRASVHVDSRCQSLGRLSCAPGAQTAHVGRHLVGS